jgi:hypothetical protein
MASMESFWRPVSKEETMKYSVLVLRRNEMSGGTRPAVITCEDKRALKRKVKESGLRPHRDVELANEGAWESLQGETVYIFPKDPVKPKMTFGV